MALKTSKGTIMKYVLKTATYAILVNFVIYFLVSFNQATFDIAQWSDWTREYTTFLYTMATIIVAVLTYYGDSE